MLDYSRCADRWNEVHEFATAHGLEENLRRNLEYLDQYANGPGCLYDREQGGDTRCILHQDFAPLSFGFTMQCRKAGEDWKTWFVGGLIFHGPHDGFGSGAAPSFSVSLTPTVGWQIHT